MKTQIHPVTSKLASPETFYHAKMGLFFIVFAELPTTDELAAYARHRCNMARESYKAVKGRTVAAMSNREHFLKMSERWAGLAMATHPRIDSMIRAQGEGRDLKVFF